MCIYVDPHIHNIIYLTSSRAARLYYATTRRAHDARTSPVITS